MSQPRSMFDRSHRIKTTFPAGKLIPILADEVLPGDTFTCKMANYTRMATPQFPIMDDMWLESFYFFVPNRLLWENWQKFCGEQINPGDATEFEVPQIEPGGSGFDFDSLGDQFGIPPDISGKVNTLHFRAYNLIWNEFFRDQNQQDSVVVGQGDADDQIADYVLLPRGKRFDYFTAALPSPQKGPSVSLPLGLAAPITSLGSATDITQIYSVGEGELRDMKANVATDFLEIGITTTGTPANALYADLTNASAATINQLRESVAIQRLYEKDSRGGTRYTEVLRSHFGVTSPDARLQRPEFLGGGSQQINFNPVSHTTGNLGVQGAFADSVGNNHAFSKSFTEHGVIIGLVAVRAALTYQNGLDKMWTRRTRWDYAWPELMGIGEQAILNKEIFYQGGAADEDVFGYIPRYEEYRFKNSRLAGAFRSQHVDSLEAWHVAQDFGSLPVLGDTWIRDNPPIDRILAVPGDIQFLFDGFAQYRCARPVTTNGIPGLTRF